MSEDGTEKLHRWESLPLESIAEGIGRRLVTGRQTMLAHIRLDKGALVPQHSHENEQFSYVLEGALRFHLEDDRSREVIVRAGEVLHIPSNIAHEAVAIEQTLTLDVFTPVRKDWLEGSDTYFREQ